MAAEKLALHHRNTFLILFIKMKIENKEIIIIFHNITVLIYFWSNKCSLGEHIYIFLIFPTPNV